jgi:DNA invertase Pin-like site-specific DNA recombinase
MRALGYCRVSSERQAEGLSLDSQAAAIRRAIETRGWEDWGIRIDVGSGKKVNPELDRTLDDLDLGIFDVLVVSRLDRLSRSVGNFASVLDRAEKHGWKVLCLDPPVDMTTPFGRAMAGVAAVFAQLERELISQRQRESVAARRAAGTYKPTKTSKLTPKLARRIAALAANGYGSTRIARQLDLEGWPTPSGGRGRGTRSTTTCWSSARRKPREMRKEKP